MKNAKHAISIFALATAFGQSPSMSRPHFAVVDYGHMSTVDSSLINAPGTELQIYYCPRAEFLSLKDVQTVTAIDDYGTIGTAHTFATGKGFYKLRVEMADNRVKHEKQDAKTGGAWKNSAQFFVRGNADELRGTAHQLSNDDMIFLIPLKDGTIAQIGGAHSECEVKPHFDSLDDNSTEKRGWMFEISAVDKYPLYYGSALTITYHT